MQLKISDYPGLEGPEGEGRLELSTGQLALVRGDSGTGKTRLLLRILDLDPEPIGRIEVDGDDVTSLPIDRLRLRMAFLMQDPPRPPMTGLELIEQVRQFEANRERCCTQAELEAKLERLELGEQLARPITELSGGENKRLWLALTLAMRSELLLLDEATAGLDGSRSGTVQELVLEALARGAAVLYITHEASPERFGSPKEYRIRRKA